MLFCLLVTEVWLNLLILQQFKGTNSCIIEAILTKFYKQIHVLVIQIHYKFHEILPVGHLVMAQFVDLNKGNNSCICEAILAKVYMHQRNIVIYIHPKCHQILLTGYLFMAPDGRDRQTDGHGEYYIYQPSAGVNENN